MTMESFFATIYSLLDIALPFAWAASLFMKRAFLEIMLITPLCAIVGIQVVNYRMAFFSDAISHSAFAGIALGLLLNINPLLTMVVFGVLVALGIAKFKTRSDLPMDTIIGVFFAATIALGIAIISTRKGLSQTLSPFLFGDVLTIAEVEIAITFALFAVVLIFIALSYNRLLLTGINEPLARSQDIPVKIYNYIFAIILAVVVTVGIRTIGMLLITALLIVPPASARNVSRNVRQMFWYSLVFAWVSGIAGLVISFYTDMATGASIILTASLCFLLTFIISLVRR
ncbi:MAG: metal ABC transporter permease [Desulfovibrionales bacterium]|nr:metal ABC transporter permease [Desulfovibrionales bacterium]